MALSSLLPDSSLVILQIIVLKVFMNQKFLKSIVIVLFILIIIALISIVYGIFFKIELNNNKNEVIVHLNEISTIKDLGTIEDITALSENKVLIKMKNDKEIFGLVYNLQNNQIIKIIKK